MGKKDKLRERCASLPTKFTWKECCSLLNGFRYVQLEGSGSRVKFHHPDSGSLISLHRPHPGNELKAYQMRLIRDKLKKDDMI